MVEPAHFSLSNCAGTSFRVLVTSALFSAGAAIFCSGSVL